MKTVARVGTSSLLVLLAFSSATSAGAQQTNDFESKGAGALKWSTRTPLPGPTGTIVNSSAFTITVGADLDPVATPANEPLLSVEMPTATVKASWSGGQSILLEPIQGALNDAAVQVHHTMAPHIDATITIAGFTIHLDYNATQLVSQIPGSEWKYNGFAKANFYPWGFAPTAVNVPPDPANLQLVSTSLNTGGLGGGLGLDPNTATGSLGINGQVDPDAFTYTTKSIGIGSGAALAAAGGSVTVPTVDADFIEFPVLVKGEITYAGHMKIGPAISLNTIGPVGPGTLTTACAVLAFNVDFVSPLPGNAGCLIDLSGPAKVADLPFGSDTAPGAPIAVAFPSTVFHIALPNVKVIDKTLDLGSVTLGESAKQPASIKNTGEMAAALSFTSSDPQFSVASKTGIMAKGSYALDITFTPTTEGVKNGTITVVSNDPNEPTQTIKVSGTGMKVFVPPPMDAGVEIPDAQPAADASPDPLVGAGRGCGCRAIDGDAQSSSYGIFGFVALGLGLLAARRRRG